MIRSREERKREERLAVLIESVVNRRLERTGCRNKRRTSETEDDRLRGSSDSREGPSPIAEMGGAGESDATTVEAREDDGEVGKGLRDPELVEK